MEFVNTTNRCDLIFITDFGLNLQPCFMQRVIELGASAIDSILSPSATAEIWHVDHSQNVRLDFEDVSKSAYEIPCFSVWFESFREPFRHLRSTAISRPSLNSTGRRRNSRSISKPGQTASRKLRRSDIPTQHQFDSRRRPQLIATRSRSDDNRDSASALRWA